MAWHWFFGFIPKDNKIVRYHNKKKSQEINIEENWVSIFMLNEKLWHWFYGYIPKDNRTVRYQNKKKS